ncbi:MAG: BrnA antitoxin family protein [Rhodobacterales bacterium]
MKSESDWDKLEAQGDSDDPEEFEVDWSSARVVVPKTKQAISLRLDNDILEYFKSSGSGYQTRMNAVLRAWMEAQLKR